jgi:hypothetical protein
MTTIIELTNSTTEENFDKNEYYELYENIANRKIITFLGKFKSMEKK